MDIYIHKGGDNLGPFTQEQIEEWLASNDFSSTDHAWHEGLEGWLPLEEVLRAAPEPSPQSDALVPQSNQPNNHGERATIYIVRGDIELGPYTVEEINTHLTTGVFRASDIAKHSGSEKLWPLLAIPGVGSSRREVTKQSDVRQQVHPTEQAAVPECAGFWVRAIAEIVDGFVMYLPHLAIKLPLLYILKTYSDTDDPAVALGVILLSLINSTTLLVIYWLYYAISESSRWQATVGKKLLGLQVVDLDGRRLTFKRASGRFFAKLLSIFTLGIGYIMAGFTARKQALHDLMAGTLVVKADTSEVPPTLSSLASTILVKAQPKPKPHSNASLIAALIVVASVAGIISLLALRSDDHPAPQKAAPVSTADSKSGTPVATRPGTPEAALASQPGGKLPTAAAPPAGTRPEPEGTSEKSPLGDLVVWHSHEQSGEGEIWLDCADDSRRTAKLCDYDVRSGQVSFSPDEGWIVVTDGGGPGSSSGTELRAFRREYQNVYAEIPDAGIAEKAAEAVLHRRNAPGGIEMVHVYAQVDGWSGDGTKLKFRVWGDDGKLSGYRLEPTAITYDMAGIESKQPTTAQQTSSQPWLTYGQTVTLQGVLLKHYHTEYLDTLPDSAEGRRRAQTPAYILRLAAPISVRATGPDTSASDPEQNAQEVYLSSLPEGTERLIDSLTGKQVAVSGKLDHAYNVHHPRPVMIDATAVSVDQSATKRTNQAFTDQNTGTPGWAATSPASQESADGDGGYTPYSNRKHGYSVVLPAALTSTLQENTSGDSVTASSNDGRLKLLLRVKQGVGTAEALYKQWTAEHTTKDPGKIVDYKTFHGNWFVVSGHDGSRGYYVKVVARGSESLFLCLEYDEEQSSGLGTMLTKVSRSFTGGIDGLAGTVVQATPPAVPKPTQTRAVDANTQLIPAAGSLSRREWRERLRKYCTIPSGHQLLSNEKRLFAVMGKPDDVEHEGRNTYWYYKCSDGVVRLAFQLDPEMMGGQIIAEVSDR